MPWPCLLPRCADRAISAAAATKLPVAATADAMENVPVWVELRSWPDWHFQTRSGLWREWVMNPRRARVKEEIHKILHFLQLARDLSGLRMSWK